jgi:hypothetical protein
MRVVKRSAVAMILVFVALRGPAAAGPGEQDTKGQPSPETVARLITELGADRFQSREEASTALEKLGFTAMPALRKALDGKNELEVRRRIEGLVARIEQNLLKSEEKNWKDLDAPRRGIKDRLVQVLVKTPDLDDRQLAAALYLLTVGRPPNPGEVEQAQKQLGGAAGRAVQALALARRLAGGKESCAAVADANVRVTKLQTAMLKEPGPLALKLHIMNSDAIQKLTNDLGASLTQAIGTDESLTDAAFLIVLSRFPKTQERQQVLAHLRKMGRQAGASDIFWSLLNTREFLHPEAGKGH